MFSGLSSIFSSSTSASANQVRQQLLSILQNPDQQSLTSLELNQWASLTYHEGQHSADDDLCEVIFQTLREVLQQPLDKTVLTLQKTLVVARHLLLVGAARVVNEAKILGPVAQPLQNYNTALLQQQQAWYMLKGGAVDQGEPVRTAATAFLQLLTLPPAQLEHERARHADPAALVPVGSATQLAFVSDPERFQNLQSHVKTLQLQKSNLVKADNGFGGGYASKDGKTVVGAAHSMDEMLQMAQQAEQKKKAAFSDTGTSRGAPQDFSEYVSPTAADFLTTTTNTNTVAPTADLLDFSATTTNHSVSTAVPSSAQQDLLSLAPAVAAVDPFAPVRQQQPPSSVHAPAGLMNTMQSTSSLAMSNPVMNNPLQQQQQQSTADPFSAFDALGGSASATMANTISSSSRMNPPASSLMPPTSPGAISAPTPHNTLNRNSGQAFADLAAGLTAGLSGLNAPTSAPAYNQNTTSSSLSVAALHNPLPSTSTNQNNDDDNGFVMGGTTGTGLQPLGPAPSAPPPPPPAV